MADEVVRQGGHVFHHLQRPLPHRSQRQRQGDGQQQENGVQQHFTGIGNLIFRRRQAVGPAHGLHQTVGGPHGEIDAEKQAEPEHRRAGGGGDIAEIGLHHIHDLHRQQRREGLGDAGDIQVQQTQQTAEENQEGEDGEQQVIGQGRALTAHVVGKVPAHHVGDKPSRTAVCNGLHPYRHRQGPPYE